MSISASTEAKSSLLLTLLPNGWFLVVFPLLLLNVWFQATSFMSFWNYGLVFVLVATLQWLYWCELHPVDWALQQVQKQRFVFYTKMLQIFSLFACSFASAIYLHFLFLIWWVFLDIGCWQCQALRFWHSPATSLWSNPQGQVWMLKNLHVPDTRLNIPCFKRY